MLYKTLTRLILTHGSDWWLLSKMDVNMPRMFKRRILRMLQFHLTIMLPEVLNFCHMKELRLSALVLISVRDQVDPKTTSLVTSLMILEQVFVISEIDVWLLTCIQPSANASTHCF
jgi:hypothetical protein